MEIRYDADSNAAWIIISKSKNPNRENVVVRNPIIEDGMANLVITFDGFGQLLYIETLDARTVLPPEVLRGDD